MAAKPIYGVGLDAGSRSTRMVICALEDGRLRFLGGGTAPSHGWLKGRIADQMAVTQSVLAAMHEVEGQIGVSVDSAVVGMGGPTVRGSNGRGVVELGHVREVEQRDVNRVVERIKNSVNKLVTCSQLQRLRFRQLPGRINLFRCQEQIPQYGGSAAKLSDGDREP